MLYCMETPKKKDLKMLNRIARLLRGISKVLMTTGHRLSWYANKLDSTARKLRNARK